MTGQQNTRSNRPATDAIREKLDAWWDSVLTGQAEGSHPTLGESLKAEVKGDTLVLSGTVPSEEDRKQVLAEAAQHKHEGIATIGDELKIVADATGEPGLLTQTLVGIFENAELAGMAVTYLRDHNQLPEEQVCIINPDSGDDARAETRARLPEPIWGEADKAIDEGHALLVLCVDETEAFKARELLDEDTRAIDTLVLPPEPAGTATASAGEPDRSKSARHGEA